MARRKFPTTAQSFATIGKTVDDAMVAIERDNPRLGVLIDVIATIELTAASEGEKTHRSVALVGRVYVYFLTRFASAGGKNGGHFYTPSCVVRCLVEMLAPYKDRIYGPACGSGGTFAQSEKFVESHGGVAKCEVRNASVEVKTSWPIIIQNLSFVIPPDSVHADTFRRDLHPCTASEPTCLLAA